jgi:DNA-binding MarR family transcriptional regulator
MPEDHSPSRPIVREESPCAMTALRKATRRVAQLYDEALAPCGLKSTQYSILNQLVRCGDAPPTMQELAALLVMDRSTLGHNLRPLERDGLLGLMPGVDDKRRRHVALTVEGKALAREARKRWQLAQRRFHDVFGEAEAAELRQTLLAIARDERLGELVD